MSEFFKKEIIRVLKYGPERIGELNKQIKGSPNTIKKYLNTLIEEGIVIKEYKGKTKYYGLQKISQNKIIDHMMNFSKQRFLDMSQMLLLNDIFQNYQYQRILKQRSVLDIKIFKDILLKYFHHIGGAKNEDFIQNL